MTKRVLSLDSDTLQVTFKGSEYELSPLRLKDQAIADKLGSESSDEVLDSIYSLLESAGLPRDISSELSMEKANELISELVSMSSKKK